MGACLSESSTWARTRSACLSSRGRPARPIASGRCCGSAPTSSGSGAISGGEARRGRECVARLRRRDARTCRRRAARGAGHEPRPPGENGDELLELLALAARGARPARLGRRGGPARLRRALAARVPPRRTAVAVCDVGGGSAQIAVGTRREGPVWVRSIDIGSHAADEPAGLSTIRPARARSPPPRRGRAVPRRFRAAARARRSRSEAAPER